MSTQRRARRADSIRNETLVRTAAVELFSELGMEITPVAIAERAGVGRATVYRTYPTRDALVAAMVRDRLAWIRALLERAVEQRDGWAGLVSFAHELLQRMRVDRGLIEVAAPTRDMEHHLAIELGELFERMLAAAKATGSVRPDVTSLDVGDLLSGMANSLRRREVDDPPSWHRAADLALAACGSYPPTAGQPRSSSASRAAKRSSSASSL